MRGRFDGDAVLEPRHPTWFGSEPQRLVAEFRVTRAAADPAVAEGASEPGGWEGLAYHRLHGSPKMYHSAYPDDYLDALASKLPAAPRSASVWCIFDNTAAGAATANALALLGRVRAG